jgi:hypothetical protein
VDRSGEFRLCAVSTKQLRRQLLAEASSTLDAQGGAVYLGNGSDRTLVNATEGWQAGDGVVHLPLRRKAWCTSRNRALPALRRGRIGLVEEVGLDVARAVELFRGFPGLREGDG